MKFVEEKLRTLSVDVANDAESMWFQHKRTEFYQGLRLPPERLVQVAQQYANRVNMMHHLSQAEQAHRPFSSLLISSHGSPGRVIDDLSPSGSLLTRDDSVEDMQLIARGKIVYICACQTGDSDLPNLLRTSGSTVVVAFRGSPSWRTDRGRDLWTGIDLMFVQGVLQGYGAEGFRSLREAALRQVEMIRGNGKARLRLASDIQNARSVLDTMVIV